MLERLVDAYPDEVQLVYRHFPLNSIHDNAQKSAEAAEAAGAQGKFWEYHDELFAKQAEWSGLSQDQARSYFIEMAQNFGLDAEKFTAELDGNVYAAYVQSLEQEAANLNLPGTPSIIFNGEYLDSLPPTEYHWNAFVQVTLLEDRQYAAAPPMTINPDDSYRAVVEMESGEQFVIELLPQSAPQTVNSFVFLAQEGWFNGVTFHRVLPGFVAQTGDPTGTGMGGPGYFVPNEIDATLSHNTAGIVAMANAGPDTNGSQWYITLGDVSQLDGSYTIFGRVIEGMEVVQNLTPRDPSQDPTGPAGDTITTITIEVGQ